MRVHPIAVAAVVLLSCSERSSPPPLAELKAKPAPQVSASRAEGPTVPTPAFRPPNEQTCTPDYRLIQGTCVHVAYRAEESVLTQKLAEYRHGAVPPMLGPQPPRSVERDPKRELGPGALIARSASGADAGSPKERRIAELDAMIAAAREQLRQRDEAAKAKPVNTTHVITAGDASVAAVVTTTPAATGVASAPAQDPTAARMAELSQLTQQLSGEQLRAITAQLGSMGMDPNQLQGLLDQAGAGSHIENGRGNER